MAKYNLLDNKKPDNLDRIFDQPDSDAPKRDADDDKSEIRPATNFYDQKEDMLDESLFEGSQPAEVPLAEQQDQKPFADSAISKAEPKKAAEPETAPKSTSIKKDDFVDEKQSRMNYKPIIIGLAIVVLVILAITLGYEYLFGPSPEEPLPVREKSTEQAAPKKLLSEKDARKKAFITQLQSEKRHRLSYFAVLNNLKVPDVYYSSILLYGLDLNFEIFSPSRDNIARFNMLIKDNRFVSNSEIVSVDQRPGKNGGVFALYSVALNQAEPSAPTGGAAITSGNRWLQDQGKRSGLNLVSSREVSAHKENLFLITRMEYTFYGTQKSCLNFLNTIANSNLNAAVHKLSMIPVNQQNFKNARFKLQLMVDLYN